MTKYSLFNCGEIRRNSEQKQTLVLLMAPQDLQLKETKNE